MLNVSKFRTKILLWNKSELKLKIKYLLIILIGIIFELSTNAQEIKINTSNKALSQVLIEIRDKYDVEFSFDDTELSKYKITVSKSFKNIEKALDYLIKDLPFGYEKISGVYIIYPQKSEIVIEKEKPKVYSISGRIMEFKTNEVLPYSFIAVNSFGMMSDQNGNFLYSSTKDSIFNIKISNMGYLIEDTIVYAGNQNINIYLTPSDQIITEVKVSENLIENFSNTGNEPATIKLNHKVTKYLPGSSDNSVFNLLRLQPGVLASGEQANDIIIWGSYAGQSRILFDGFTVFGLKNFNDNISAINPLITKNIQLKKAGYDASYGDCVGGIVDISGKDGNTQKTHFSIGINNFTLNSLLEIPILKKSSLQIAYRQTYYNLYNDGFKLFPKADSARNSNLSDIYVYPDYTFRDFNIKYTLKTNDNLFYVSVLNSNDKFEYSFNKTLQYREIIKTTNEENHQTGASVFFEKKMNNKISSSLTISYSELSTDLTDNYDIFSSLTKKLVNQKKSFTNNEIFETKAKFQTVYRTNKNQTFEFTLQALNNTSKSKEDSSKITISESKNSSSYYTFGLKDIISFSGKNLDLGFRASYLPYVNQVFIEPRISYSQSINTKFKYNLAWGIYNQFLVKSSILDEYDNYRYFWTISNNENIPILQANHLVAGFSYSYKDLSINIDAFYKNTNGLTRYVKIPLLIKEDIYKGNGKSYGFDFYAKYNLSKHTIWLSYTYSKSLEHFSYFKNEEYLYAPQDQRHEIKLASIINLKPIFLSANYVFGSGFLEKPFRQKNNSNRIPYSRLDVSATYQFSKTRNIGECGISILNVLNTRNQKISNFEKIPISQTGSVNIYFEAIPFTPTIFLKLNL